MNVVIQPWQPQDNDTFLAWLRIKPSIADSMGMGGMDELDIRKELVLSATSPTMQRFMAFRGEEPVAAIAVYDVRADGSAFGSFVANPESTGFATVASSKQTLAALFNGIGINDLRVIVSDENKPSLKLARLMGFEDMNVRQLRLTKDGYNGPGNRTGDR